MTSPSKPGLLARLPAHLRKCPDCTRSDRFQAGGRGDTTMTMAGRTAGGDWRRSIPMTAPMIASPRRSGKRRAAFASGRPGHASWSSCGHKLAMAGHAAC
jgi:hypothetical protein